MTNLEQRTSKETGLTLVFDIYSGDVYATQRGLARLVGVDESTLRYFKGAGKLTTQTAEVRVQQGFKGAGKLTTQTAELYDATAIRKVVLRYKPELAEQFMELGMKLVLQRLCNYEQSSHSVMAAVDDVVTKLRKQHKKEHLQMHRNAGLFGLPVDTLPRLCVWKVSGIRYEDFMSGSEYNKRKWSPDFMEAEMLEKMTSLKSELNTMALTNKEKAERDVYKRGVMLVERAAKRAGI